MKRDVPFPVVVGMEIDHNALYGGRGMVARLARRGTAVILWPAAARP